jgi:phospholipid/cholesterol/gamma-HCH transport system substrate-binding protein
VYKRQGFGSAELVILPDFEAEDALSGTFLQSKTKADPLSGITSKLNPISTKLDQVLKNVNELVVGLNSVLDTNTQNNLKQSFAKLNGTLTSFKSASSTLNQMLTENKDKLGSVLTNADKASANLKNMTDDFAKANIATNLKETVTKLNTTLNSFDSVIAKVKDGDGSVAKLLNDKGLYTNLENASKELEELLREMKEHPKRFVHFSLFGKKDKGYKKDTVK